MKISTAQKKIEKAIKNESEMDFENAAINWREAADFLKKVRGQEDIAAHCFTSHALCIISYQQMMGVHEKKLEGDIEDFSELLEEKLMKFYPDKAEINGLMVNCFSQFEALFTRKGMLSLAGFCRKKKKKQQLIDFKSKGKWTEYLKLKTSQLTCGFGASLNRLIVSILLLIAVFWVVYGASGTVIFKDTQITVKSFSFDLFYFSLINFFGGSVDNMIVCSVFGKTIAAVELFFGFLSLAYLVNIFLRSWYSD